MPESVKEFPVFPDGLWDAIRNRKIILFIGNGVYRSSGSVGWVNFSKNIIQYCYENGILKNYSECQAFQSISDKITEIPNVLEICKKRAIEIKNPFVYYNAVRNTLPRPKRYELLDLLLKLNPHSIVTTNVDSIFQDIYYKIPSEIDINNLDNYDTYFQIHGNINERESLVLTASEYHQNYSSDSKLTGFLEKVFSRTVLFIGYGINEYPLTKILFKVRDKIEGNSAYTLSPWTAYMRSDCDITQENLENLYNIKTIYYSCDKNSWGQLNNVLFDLVNRISVPSKIEKDPSRV